MFEPGQYLWFFLCDETSIVDGVIQFEVCWCVVKLVNGHARKKCYFMFWLFFLSSTIFCKWIGCMEELVYGFSCSFSHLSLVFRSSCSLFPCFGLDSSWIQLLIQAWGNSTWTNRLILKVKHCQLVILEFIDYEEQDQIQKVTKFKSKNIKIQHNKHHKIHKYTSYSSHMYKKHNLHKLKDPHPKTTNHLGNFVWLQGIWKVQP